MELPRAVHLERFGFPLVFLVFLLALPALPVETEKPATPAQFLEILGKSELTYELGDIVPVSKPVQEMSCNARSPELRLVRSSGGAELVSWKPSGSAEPHFERAEKLYAEKSYIEAGEEYAKGLALDPDYGPGWLYSGDIPFLRGDWEAALASYRKALALDPTLAMGHRFAGDALLKLGRWKDAEDEYVKALVYEPTYEGVWQALDILGRRDGFAVRRPAFSPPEGAIGERTGKKVQVGIHTDQTEWLGYLLCKTVWRHEDGYRRRKLGEKEAGRYGWTLREERECLASLVEGSLSQTWTRLEEEAVAQGRSKREIDDAQVLAAAPELVRHLVEVEKAGLLDGYALFAVVGSKCPMTLSLMPQELLAEVESYIRRFVIVREPPPLRAAARRPFVA